MLWLPGWAHEELDIHLTVPLLAYVVQHVWGYTWFQVLKYPLPLCTNLVLVHFNRQVKDFKFTVLPVNFGTDRDVGIIVH